MRFTLLYAMDPYGITGTQCRMSYRMSEMSNDAAAHLGSRLPFGLTIALGLAVAHSGERISSAHINQSSKNPA